MLLESFCALADSECVQCYWFLQIPIIIAPLCNLCCGQDSSYESNHDDFRRELDTFRKATDMQAAAPTWKRHRAAYSHRIRRGRHTEIDSRQAPSAWASALRCSDEYTYHTIKLLKRNDGKLDYSKEDGSTCSRQELLLRGAMNDKCLILICIQSSVMPHSYHRAAGVEKELRRKRPTLLFLLKQVS